MIDLLLLLLLLACLGITAAWMAENPGSVTIHWFDYRIDTSFAFLLLAALAAAVLLAIALLLVRRLVLAPSRMAERRYLKHYRHGLTEITHSVAALASADVEAAIEHTRRAEKLLGRTPLTLLLSAQVARIRGDEPAARLLLEQMLGHGETEYLAARSLSDAASKQQSFPKALAMAERAQAVNPKDVLPLISLNLRLEKWQEALLAIRKAARKGHINRATRRRYEGIIYLQQGRQCLAAGRNEAALAAAGHALKLLPGFVPTVLLAAKTHAIEGQQRKALKILLRAWDASPHPQLATALRAAIAAEPEARRAKLMKNLAAAPTATSDTPWACRACGQPAAQWEPHCPACGAFDTLG